LHAHSQLDLLLLASPVLLPSCAFDMLDQKLCFGMHSSIYITIISIKLIIFFFRVFIIVILGAKSAICLPLFLFYRVSFSSV
jgi:hypothetical protein